MMSSLGALVRRSARVSVAPLIGALIIFGLWYLVIAAFDIKSFVLSSPDEIAASFVEDFDLIIKHAVPTMTEVLGGLGLSIAVGVVLAVLIVEVPPFSRAILPWLVMSQAIPKVAVAPLFVIWFGFGLAPKVVVAFVIAFFPIVISTASGLRSVSTEEIDLFRTMTNSRWAVYRYLKIPRASVQFFDGVKVGTTLVLIGAVVGEFVSSQEGLGYLVLIANRNLQTDLMFATFVALSIMGIVLFYAVEAIERLMIPWYYIQQAGAQGGK